MDLSSRIGARTPFSPPPPAPPPTEPSVRRLDGPIDSAGRARTPAVDPDGPAVPQSPPTSRPTAGAVDAQRPQATPRPAILDDEPAPEPPLLSVREAPGVGEIDLVATPLLTPDDWHHFELALRKLRGISELRTEYYRAGVLKVRVRWSGADRFANAVRSVPGYRVKVLGEDRNTVQVLVGRP